MVIPSTPTIAGWVGTGLTRPECALAHSSGLICVPSWAGSGGVSIINARGDTRHILAKIPASLNTWLDEGLKPNGIALEANGRFLLAHLGEERGGIFRMDARGQVLSTKSRWLEWPTSVPCAVLPFGC